MNQITLAWCDEDRARIDRLTVALEEFTKKAQDISPKCDQCAKTVADFVSKKMNLPKESALAECPENAPESTEAEPPATPQQVEEKPAQAEDAPAETAKPAITLEQIQQKVVQLAAANGGAKKVKVREIIKAHATMVSELPESTWAEVWEKLTALEKED